MTMAPNLQMTNTKILRQDRHPVNANVLQAKLLARMQRLNLSAPSIQTQRRLLVPVYALLHQTPRLEQLVCTLPEFSLYGSKMSIVTPVSFILSKLVINIWSSLTTVPAPFSISIKCGVVNYKLGMMSSSPIVLEVVGVDKLADNLVTIN